MTISHYSEGDGRANTHRTMTRRGTDLPAVVADLAVGWHALYTRHQHEKVAARILREKGFEVFLPLYTAMHRWKDRRKQVSMPLFPGYVFLQGGLERRQELLSTIGVHSLVRVGNQVAVIPDHEINTVRQAVTACPTAEPHPYMRSGDRVFVSRGPLSGVEGILLRKKDDLRLILSIELLKRSIAVEIDAYAVAPGSTHLPAEITPGGEIDGVAAV